jgi:hypothetical protein
MNRYLAILFFVAGCSSSHAILRTEVVINGNPSAGNIFCTNVNQEDCKDAMTQFCKGKVSIVKVENEQVCYVVPSPLNGTKKGDAINWDKACDSVKSVSFVCVE